jgi:hypothetical protein
LLFLRWWLGRVSFNGEKLEGPGCIAGSPEGAKKYTIKGRIICAEGLSLRVRGGSVDPYAVVSLAGTKLYHSTAFLDDSSVPFWEEDFQFESGGSPANNLLRISVHSKNDTGRHGPPIGAAVLFVREIPFGVGSTHKIGLQPGDAKLRPSAGTEPGSAGYIYISFVVLRDGGTRPVELQVPLWDFHIEFTSCSLVPGDTKRHVPRYSVFARLRNTQNKQRFKSAFARSSTPVWKATHVFAVADTQKDVVAVHLIQQDDRTGGVHVGTAAIPVADFTPAATYDVREYRIEPTDAARTVGTLRVKAAIRRVAPAKASKVTLPKDARRHSRPEVQRPFDSAALYASQDGSGRRQIERREPIGAPPGDVGNFNWGDGGSEFSTDFSSYTGKGSSLSDGPMATGQSGACEGIIVHRHFLEGKVISGRGLGRGMKYLIVDLIGRKQSKGKKKASDLLVTADKDHIALNFDFGEVKKGWSVEFTLGRKHPDGNERIGVARIPIKDIEVDASQPLQIQLLDPEKGELSRGDLLVELQHHID